MPFPLPCGSAPERVDHAHGMHSIKRRRTEPVTITRSPLISPLTTTKKTPHLSPITKPHLRTGTPTQARAGTGPKQEAGTGAHNPSKQALTHLLL